MNESLFVQDLFHDHILVTQKSLVASMNTIPHMADVICKSINMGGKLLICGNGGSAADAQHLAAEFVSSFSKSIKRPGLPAIALTTDTSILTAYSNDFSFDDIFFRQLEALGKSGDVLLVFSTSGNSKNCLNAVEYAKFNGISTLGFAGIGGKLSTIVDHCFSVASDNTQHIQEVHQVAYHILAGLVEKKLF
jgi:D-sedoheptulose 7-phosphate isomerase